ncbi:MAG: Uma2 family endonuclease [Cyanobacteria bacterium J06648_16]
MVNAPPTLKTDVWTKATWDEFLSLAARPELGKARFYYDDGRMRIETMPIGLAHSRDNSILAAVITLYGALKNIQSVTYTNGSFRKVGERECQPDLAYYIGPDMRLPLKSNQPLDINQYGPPQLAIEIFATTLSDDLGEKRLLYERLGVSEYWVVDVAEATVIAFSISNGGSYRIQTSAVLPDLSISVIEEALRRSQTENDGVINRWLLEQFG